MAFHRLVSRPWNWFLVLVMKMQQKAYQELAKAKRGRDRVSGDILD